MQFKVCISEDTYYGERYCRTHQRTVTNDNYQEDKTIVGRIWDWLIGLICLYIGFRFIKHAFTRFDLEGFYLENIEPLIDKVKERFR